MQRRFTMGGMGRHLVGHGMNIGLPMRVSNLVGNRRRRHHMRGRGVFDDVWSGIKSAGSWVGENIGKVFDTASKASKLANLAGVDTSKFDSGISKAKDIYSKGSSIAGSRRRKIRGGMFRRLGTMRGGNVWEDIGKGSDWILDRADKISNIVGKIVQGAKLAGAARRKHKKVKGKGKHRKVGRPKIRK